jgi:two-component system, OmpR family, sensor histidine kinase SenX3
VFDWNELTVSDYIARPNRQAVAAAEDSHSGQKGSKKLVSKKTPELSKYFRPDSIALLAHQLMTPLSTISSAAQGMIRRAGQMDENDIRTRAEKIQRAGARLTELVETIMAHTRAKAGVISLDTRDFDLQALVQKICRQQSEHSSSHPFTLNIDCLPKRYRGDPLLLEQVIVIILSNAIKYSPADCPITVTGGKAEGEISISVKDQGIGILSEDLPHLTQPFFRGQNAQHMPGTGLGLSLAHHILELHGGGLKLESREGQGTVVTINLPEIHAFSSGSGI